MEIKNLGIDDCLEVLASNYIGRLGYIFGQTPFIIPITFSHDVENKCIVGYSAEGHKLVAMRQYDRVALQVDEIETIHSWKSVLVQGRFEELKGSEAKLYLHRFAEGVRETMKRRGIENAKFIKDFSSKLDTRGLPIVYKISVNDISGKYRND